MLSGVNRGHNVGEDVSYSGTVAGALQGMAFGIRSIPTLMVFREQIMLFQQAGALPANGLEQLIGQVRSVDMDEVRRQIEAEKPGQ